MPSSEVDSGAGSGSDLHLELSPTGRRRVRGTRRGGLADRPPGLRHPRRGACRIRARRQAPGRRRARVAAELRAALADYLARVRGVRTSPEHIVVYSGFAHGLRLLFGGVPPGPLAVEAYGLPFHRGILDAVAIRTVVLGLDEGGARTDRLGSHPGTAGWHGARSVLLTPAHQFPTGGPLHPARRTSRPPASPPGCTPCCGSRPAPTPPRSGPPPRRAWPSTASRPFVTRTAR